MALDRGVSFDVSGLTFGFPDSRLRGPACRATTRVYHGRLFDRVFCANCGADGGLVTTGAPFMFYVCNKLECIKAATQKRTVLEIPEAVARGALVTK